MSIKSNLTVDLGANFLYNVYLIDANGTAIDISGYTGNCQIRKTYTSTTYNTMNVAITGASGLVSLTMNSTVTANLTSTRYVYDLELSSNNVVSRILEGTITVSPQVTR